MNILVLATLLETKIYLTKPKNVPLPSAPIILEENVPMDQKVETEVVVDSSTQY